MMRQYGNRSIGHFSETRRAVWRTLEANAVWPGIGIGYDSCQMNRGTFCLLTAVASFELMIYQLSAGSITVDERFTWQRQTRSTTGLQCVTSLTFAQLFPQHYLSLRGCAYPGNAHSSHSGEKSDRCRRML
jgi:hypothetical protein